MKYPVTKRAIVEEFPSLHIENSNIDIQQRVVQEIAVYGEWPASKLSKAFLNAGFERVGKKDDMAFVNQDSTVGIVCYGMEVDQKSNRFKTLYFELQARSKAQAAKGVVPYSIW